MFKVDSLVSALWSRDASSLWHGIRRSVTPTLDEGRSKIILHQLTLLAMIALPFFLLPYTAAMVYDRSDYGLAPSMVATNSNMISIYSNASSISQPQYIQNPILNHTIVQNPVNGKESYLKSLLLWFDFSLCLLAISATGIKCVMKYRLVPLYSGLCFVGSLFLIASYAYSTLPLLIGSRTKPIKWRGRQQHVPSRLAKKNKSI
jgi:hypothetical protein